MKNTKSCPAGHASPTDATICHFPHCTYVFPWTPGPNSNPRIGRIYPVHTYDQADGFR